MVAQVLAWLEGKEMAAQVLNCGGRCRKKNEMGSLDTKAVRRDMGSGLKLLCVSEQKEAEVR